MKQNDTSFLVYKTALCAVITALLAGVGRLSGNPLCAYAALALVCTGLALAVGGLVIGLSGQYGRRGRRPV